MAATYSELPNKLVSAANGVDYAYREAGGGTVPLVLLQHFRGNLDNWDPALIDALAANRHVVTFDNAGVGGSAGTTPNSVGQMAHDAIAFLAAMGFGQVDVLGFSIGSFVAQVPFQHHAEFAADCQAFLSGQASLRAAQKRRPPLPWPLL